jgi:hypothetical protein
MAYYVDKIEQIVGTKEAPVNEYGSRTKKGSYDEALTSFYTDLMNVSNDIHTEETPAKKHYFMDIRIVDSKGGVVKKDSVGTHQE